MIVYASFWETGNEFPYEAHARLLEAQAKTEEQKVRK